MSHHEHALRFRQVVSSVDVHVALEVLQQVLDPDGLSVDEFGDQVVGSQQHRYQLHQRALELTFDICEDF